MAKVRQSYGETRFVPWLGRDVDDGDVVDVPDNDLPSYLEAGWQPADEATTVAHRELLADGTVTVGEFQAEPAGEAEPVKES